MSESGRAALSRAMRALGPVTDRATPPVAADAANMLSVRDGRTAVVALAELRDAALDLRERFEQRETA